ncbi:MAG: hypothetical protein HOE55_02475, partial [Thiotrichales bacterium]|nr:hypothetical protein [Thiotrichales bacterium]MBT5418801.1 hypothetical protein [Thiotrichales bacterium]MBT6173739.1 hypothetical protein [Thiotrichales bacterium]MBT6810257.1 hypothetical protein [Thiotrichales bacterium]
MRAQNMREQSRKELAVKPNSIRYFRFLQFLLLSLLTLGLFAGEFALASEVVVDTVAELAPAPQPERGDYPNIGASSRAIVWVIA